MFAPALDGFGIQATYSRNDSSVSLSPSGFNADTGTQNIPLPGLSKDTYNLTVYFEKAGFAARVAQRYRSDFVGEVTNIFGDRTLTYVKAERVVDAQISYEFQSGWAKGLSLLFQGSNLNDAEFVRYRDTPSNVIERTKYGATYLIGVNYKL
jgi:iron complex outermembrane receptor protein